MEPIDFEKGLMKKSKSFLVDFLKKVITRMNELESEVKILKRKNKPLKQ